MSVPAIQAHAHLDAGRIIEQKTARRAAIRKAWPAAADRVREAFADLVG